MKKVILHGECMVFPSKIPTDAKRINPTNGQFMIVADSETTGNHHVVDVNPSTNFFQNEGGTIYMENKEATQIRCVHTDRHDAVELPANTWEFGAQQEYDYLTQELRNVAD